MVVVKLVLTLRLNEVNSIKDKRNLISGLFKKIQTRYNVSCAEIGELDEIRMVDIAFVAVGRHYDNVHKTMNRIINFIDSYYEFEIINIEFSEY